MRRVNMSIVLLFVGLGVASAAHSQVWSELRTQSADEIARSQTDFWKRTLGLSDEQTAALHEINQRYAADMRTTVRVPGADASKLGTMETLENQKTAELLEMLTPAQRSRYLQFTSQVERSIRPEAQ